jgi:hypothetical protein
MIALIAENGGGDEVSISESPPLASVMAIRGEGGGGGMGAELGGIDGGSAGIVGVVSGSEVVASWRRPASASHGESRRAHASAA